MKKIISVILSLTLIVCFSFNCAPAVSAETYTGACGDNLSWEYNDENETLTITGVGDMTDYSASEHAPWYMYRKYVTSIVIGEEVTSIGNRAFYSFSGLISIILSDSVTDIGAEAFGRCSLLKSFVLPNGVKTIGKNAFAECIRLSTITLPSSLTYLSDYLFDGCTSLKSITVPKDVSGIGEGAFNGCTELTRISVDKNNEKYYSDGNCVIEKNTKTLVLGCQSSIIPDDVTGIGDYAFLSCYELTKIDIPSSVTSIGYEAFAWCYGLTSITIPVGVTSIGASAFSYCRKITSVTLPKGVTSIGSFTFYGCNELTSVTLLNNTVNIGDSAFENCNSLNNVYFLGTETQKNSLNISSDNTDIIYSKWHYCSETVNNPSCTETGSSVISCSDCTYSITTILPATGHNYSVTTISPTCISKGYDVHTCLKCNDSYKDNYTNFSQHVYTPVVTSPDCTKAGYTTYTCETCKGSYVSDYVSALGHNFEDVVTNPTCKEKGYTTHTCTRCTESYVDSYTSVVDHNFGEWLTRTETSCIEQGEEYRVCSVCKAEETRKISVTGHNYIPVVTSPDCTKAGYTTYTCETCKGSYVSDYVSALGHNFETTVHQPDCTQNGYTEYKCSRCDSQYNSDYVNMLGHDYQVTSNTATCTEDGIITYTCSLCKDVFSRPYITRGHTFSDEWTVDTEPTYLSEGEKSRHCLYCEERTSISSVPVKLHTGNCTDTVEWGYNEVTKQLIVFGEGELPEYSDAFIAEPWYMYKGKITSLVVEEGITGLGVNTFSKLTMLETVILPSDIIYIGDGVFANCKKLSSINLENVTSTSDTAFYGCSSLIR